MRVSNSVLYLSAITLLIFLPSAIMADPWKDESGHGKHKERGGSYYNYEEARGDCKREYKRGRGGYKYEEKCSREDRRASGPPPWAPAHGYRTKHRSRVNYEQAPHYQDSDPHEEYTTVTEELGIPHGTCNRHVLGGILGGVVGGALGSRVGEGDGKTLATIAGAVAGILVGRHIGHTMDEADQQCIGQVLERAQDRQTVAWRNPDTGVEYEITPQRTYESQGRHCREYMTEASIGGGTERVQGMACRSTDGTWRVADQSRTM